MRYETTTDAAENICVLVDYLEATSSSTRYIYRGQIQEWNGPLLPSIYRRCIPLQQAYTGDSDKYRYCLRRCGKLFIEIKPDSFVEKIMLDEKDHKLAAGEYEAMVAFALDPDFSLLIATEGFEFAIRRKLRSDRLTYVLKRLPLWKQIVDELQRGFIRHIAFLQPFGYMLGMTLAQQYGFASELLDFTSDLRVAAFFATHDYPTYRLFAGRKIAEGIDSQVGVIYRLPSTEGNVRYTRLDEYNYYSCPNQLHLKDLCIRFEDRSSPDIWQSYVESLDYEDFHQMATAVYPSLEWRQLEQDMFRTARSEMDLEESIDRFLYHYFYSTGVRHFRFLDLPSSSFSRSRLGRQSAVMIVPDELRIEDPSDKSATFQAIEDLKSREGFDSFYFKHSHAAPDLNDVNRENLWPKENDVFRTLISRVLLPSTPVYGYDNVTLPKRLDLVSEGYETEKH